MSILKLRKRLYRNNGSVLFIVLVVMSMMIILATTTMYVVYNQHASIEVHYASEQSYQSAKSVSTAVSSFLDKQFEEIKGGANGSGTLAKKILEGKSITSESIDLSSMGFPGSTATVEIKNGIEGAPSPTPGVTRTYYEVTTTATVNNETSSLTELRYFDEGQVEYYTDFLTCTGEKPEDVVIKSRDIYGDAHFENLYTEITGGTYLHNSLYCYGNLNGASIVYDQFDPNSCDFKEIVVKGNFEVRSDAGSDSVRMPYIFVGGDFTCERKIETAKSIFVNGDFTSSFDGNSSTCKYFINEDMHARDGMKGTYYINGNLYLEPGYKNSGGTTFYVKGNVINNSGKAQNDLGANFVTANYDQIFDEALKNSCPALGITTWDDVTDHIDNTATKQKYEEWDAEGYFDKQSDDDIEDVDFATKTEKKVVVPKQAVIGKDQFVRLHTNSTASGKTLYLDATDNDVYVYLDDDGTGEFKLPDSSNIVYTGDHSVVLIVPEDANFKFPSDGVFGNIQLLKTIKNQTNLSDDAFLNDLLARQFTNNSYQTARQNLVKFDESTTTTETKDGVTIIKNQEDGKKSQNAYITAPDVDNIKVNNNMFLVTKGTSNEISFSCPNSLMGYLYAPKATLKATDGWGEGFAFFGGLIAGTYNYKDQVSGLIFAKPKDYGGHYGGSDIISHLMNKSGGGAGSNGVTDAGTIGYK